MTRTFIKRNGETIGFIHESKNGWTSKPFVSPTKIGRPRNFDQATQAANDVRERSYREG
jgi:hypothetical protein